VVGRELLRIPNTQWSAGSCRGLDFLSFVVLTSQVRKWASNKFFFFFFFVVEDLIFCHSHDGVNSF